MKGNMNEGTTKTTKYMDGKVELSIGAMTINPRFLSELTVTFTTATRTAASLAGNITQPSNMVDTATVTGNFILPSMDALKTLFQGAYEASSVEDLAGRVRIGGDTCKTLEGLPVHIHPVCDKNDENDVHIYDGIVAADLTLTYNQSDMLMAAFTIYAQPTDDGYAIIGTGDLTKEVLYDAATQSWAPVATGSASNPAELSEDAE